MIFFGVLGAIILIYLAEFCLILLQMGVASTFIFLKWIFTHKWVWLGVIFTIILVLIYYIIIGNCPIITETTIPFNGALIILSVILITLIYISSRLIVRDNIKWNAIISGRKKSTLGNGDTLCEAKEISAFLHEKMLLHKQIEYKYQPTTSTINMFEEDNANINYLLLKLIRYFHFLGFHVIVADSNVEIEESEIHYIRKSDGCSVTFPKQYSTITRNQVKEDKKEETKYYY